VPRFAVPASDRNLEPHRGGALVYPSLVKRAARGLPWLLGLAALVAVVVVALRFAEGEELLRTVARVEPVWLLTAAGLQAATYLAEAQGWRRVARAALFPLPLATAYQLSLAKLFIDQALPSGGISGTVFFARALGELGMPRPAVMAGVVVDIATYYGTYVICLAAALVVTLVRKEATVLVGVLTGVFAVFAVGVLVSALVLSGRGAGAISRRLARVPPARRLLRFLEDADPHLARSPRVLLAAGAWQLSVFVLDATTVWALIQASGVSVPLPGVFASFMISTLFRTLGVLPAGLGTFEATSVITLSLIGVPVAVALSATLLFRGLSFWLPMLPGLWLSRRALPRSAGTRASTPTGCSSPPS